MVGWKIDTGWDGHGQVFNPANQVRTYEDIEAIFRGNRKGFETFEEKTVSGKFKKFTVETR